MHLPRTKGSAWTLSELRAFKKNMAEDARLRTTMISLDKNYHVTADSLNNRIRETRVDLRNVRMSTGHSIDALPPSVFRWRFGAEAEAGCNGKVAGWEPHSQNPGKWAFPVERHGTVSPVVSTSASADFRKLPGIKSGAIAEIGKNQTANEDCFLHQESEERERTPEQLSARPDPRGKNKGEVTLTASSPWKNNSAADDRLDRVASARSPAAFKDRDPSPAESAFDRTSHSERPHRERSGDAPTRCRTCLQRFRSRKHQEERTIQTAEAALTARMRSLTMSLPGTPSETAGIPTQTDPPTPARAREDEENELIAQWEESKATRSKRQVEGRITPARKGYSQRRLEVLATPRVKASRRLHFAKGHIRDEVTTLTQQHMSSRMTSLERENLRRLESRVRMFLTVLRCSDHRTAMVHIPQRDDIMSVDISHIY